MSTYIKTLKQGSDTILPRTKTNAISNQSGDNLDAILMNKADLVNGKVPSNQLPAMDYIPTSQKGAASGVASLGSDGKVPTSQIPSLGYIPTSQKGVANGVASLGLDGKVPSSQLTATGYSKSETLTAATAALYGLPSTAVPNNVFAYLGKYAEHCWKRRVHTFLYSEKKTLATMNYTISSGTFTIQYASSIACDANGAHLVNPSTATINNSTTGMHNLVALAPCYFISSNAQNFLFYLPSGSTSGSSATYTVFSSGASYVSGGASVRASVVTVETTETIGEWEFIFSTNRNAYPDGGIVGNYEYDYVGIPFENLPTIPRIETGSYVGTGTYGQSNPNSLTFSFAPKLVLLLGYDYYQASSGTRDYFSLFGASGNGGLAGHYAVYMGRLDGSYKSSCGFRVGTFGHSAVFAKKSADGKTLYWYSTNTSTGADGQANAGNSNETYTYHYLAIG